MEQYKRSNIKIIMIFHGRNNGETKKETNFGMKYKKKSRVVKVFLMLIGDWNGKVGKNSEKSEGRAGKFRENTKNNNGQKIVNRILYAK